MKVLLLGSCDDGKKYVATVLPKLHKLRHFPRFPDDVTIATVGVVNGLTFDLISVVHLRLLSVYLRFYGFCTKSASI